MSGFKFKGIHSKDKYIKAIRSSRTLVPEPKHTFVDIPFKNGSILVYDNTSSDIIIPVRCFFEIPKNKSIFDVGREWATWLTTDKRVQLVFDDDPGYYYNAVCISSINVEDLRDKKKNEVTIEFRCMPEMVAVSS